MFNVVPPTVTTAVPVTLESKVTVAVLALTKFISVGMIWLSLLSNTCTTTYL